MSDTTGFRAAYFDVDGTLVDARRRFHPRTLVALQRMRRRGLHRALATGRMWASARPFAEAVDADLPLVLYNGARVVDPASGRTLEETRLPRELAGAALELAREHGLHINLYQDDALFVERMDDRALGSMTKDGSDPQLVDRLEQVLDHDPVKLLCIGEPATCVAFQQAVDTRLGRPAPTVVRSESEYVEVLAPGVTKGRALAQALRHAGLDPAEVVACGDNLNDLELLDLVGHAVVPESGHPDARARADRVIGHHDSGALGDALIEIFHLEETT